MSSKLAAKCVSNTVAIDCPTVLLSLTEETVGAREVAAGAMIASSDCDSRSPSSKKSSLDDGWLLYWLAKSEARGEDKRICTGVEGIGSV